MYHVRHLLDKKGLSERGCLFMMITISKSDWYTLTLLLRSPCYNGCLSSPAAFSLPLYLSGLLSIAIGKM